MRTDRLTDNQLMVLDRLRRAAEGSAVVLDVTDLPQPGSMQTLTSLEARGLAREAHPRLWRITLGALAFLRRASLAAALLIALASAPTAHAQAYDPAILADVVATETRAFITSCPQTVLEMEWTDLGPPQCIRVERMYRTARHDLDAFVRRFTDVEWRWAWRAEDGVSTRAFITTATRQTWFVALWHDFPRVGYSLLIIQELVIGSGD